MFLHFRPIVIYLTTLALPLLECYGPVNTGRDLHAGQVGIPSPPRSNNNRWRAMVPSTHTNNDEMYNIPPQVVRVPRRIRPGNEHHERPRNEHRERPISYLSVEPRAFQEDHLPSTPQLNAIMDRAMGKVKSMVKELEHEKGLHKLLILNQIGEKQAMVYFVPFPCYVEITKML